MLNPIGLPATGQQENLSNCHAIALAVAYLLRETIYILFLDAVDLLAGVA
jgi:hypothetical protein